MMMQRGLLTWLSFISDTFVLSGNEFGWPVARRLFVFHQSAPDNHFLLAKNSLNCIRIQSVPILEGRASTPSPSKGEKVGVRCGCR